MLHPKSEINTELWCLLNGFFRRPDLGRVCNEIADIRAVFSQRACDRVVWCQR